MTNKIDFSAFRDVPYMGVIWVVAEAMKRGFYNGNPEWFNLGQGQPEVGEMKGAPPRIDSIQILPGDHAYGPLSGSLEIREKIAAHYNRLYRTEKKSKYTADNVSVVMGGRLALTRVFAALGKIRLGYRNPDYTAYEDIMNYHAGKITPVEIFTSFKNNFDIPAKDFESVLKKNKLNAYLISNPCNPTGNVIKGKKLERYVKVSTSNNCALILDEFYSHFIYDGNSPSKAGVSGAEFVRDVDKDPVLLIDGLTKSYRYPGWRIGWIIGPKQIIENVNRAASAVDGGPSQPMMRAAAKVLEPANADQETKALRETFSRKRNLMLKVLTENGIQCLPCEGTFYIWGNISKLPSEINKALPFFYAALEQNVLTVPGYFFNIKAANKKSKKSVFDQWVRFSFGPPENNMKEGLRRLTVVIKSFKTTEKRKND